MADKEEMRKNLEFFKDNLAEWLANDLYRNKHAVIAEQKLKGLFDNFPNAFDYASSNLTLGECVIQQVISDDERISYIASAL